MVRNLHLKKVRVRLHKSGLHAVAHVPHAALPSPQASVLSPRSPHSQVLASSKTFYALLAYHPMLLLHPSLETTAHTRVPHRDYDYGAWIFALIGRRRLFVSVCAASCFFFFRDQRARTAPAAFVVVYCLRAHLRRLSKDKWGKVVSRRSRRSRRPWRIVSNLFALPPQ